MPLPYLLAIVIPVAALLILVVVAIRLRRGVRQLMRVRGWLVDTLTYRTSLVRARTAAAKLAARQVGHTHPRTM